MGLSKKPYKGTRDFFPELKRIQDYVFEAMKVTAQSFGYEHYDGPILEEVDLYLAKSGEELINEQIYSFEDRGGRNVAIRPEMTPTVARMVAQVHRNVAKPIRWFSIPNLMRYERPQRGRLREHWQFNCDIFGAPENLGEIEILQVVISLMKRLGANHEQFEVRINNRKVVDFVFQNLLNLEEAVAYKLYKLLDRYYKLPEDKRQEQLVELIPSTEKREIFNRYIEIDSFERLETFLSENQASSVSDIIEQFITLAKTTGIHSFLKYDPCIVRGLDYYTATVFEVFDKNPKNPRAICGGGSYENLLKIFNEDPVAGVGFGLGDVTLVDFLTTHELLPESLQRPSIELAISYQTQECLNLALELSAEIRNAGLDVELFLGTMKFKKVFGHAENRGAKNLVIIGENELEQGQFSVKELATRETLNFRKNELNKLIDFIRKN